MRRISVAILPLFFFWLSSAVPEVPRLEPYQRVSGISGNLSSIGSDSLANLMTLWSEAFQEIYPSVNVQVQAAGSSTAPLALVQGTADFGPMSRLMKGREIDAFEARYGYAPTVFRVAADALTVYVHRDNPIESLSLPQVDAIFSRTRRCGALGDVREWRDVGLGGRLERTPLQLYGRNAASGTYGYFKQHVLCSGDFKDTVNEQPGSASVVQAVSSSPSGIGYSGIGYRTSGVRAVPLAVEEGLAPVMPSAATASNRSYPLSRYLYVYVNKPPQGRMRPLNTEFLRFVLSETGQGVAEKDGFVPLTTTVALREQRKIE
ncbi:MAG: phosphate ABC transporter substrate-binding protein PstS family protein [Gammaproteobacteria bacterium]|nr:phosphate ABC transporter substrate-binding protein PstS family protein [Gammaproteobacteria bacterium]MCY4199738.1 phosphate ABC transporter substrate-binding protein PstS family protein [Gammaproteobacteria bacterium]MCY4276597.1 phosphate ABC transporter substrate-binding protein PstS family protein [Gammaproteobacteria bacterium]MCY4323649.1 phosphate ABC transporter substrate-binding protein PstS family protein [Gammaproteobacteria bacterium]